MYYFYNVAPGSYTLYLTAPWGFRSSTGVAVHPGGITDIPPIQIN